MGRGQPQPHGQRNFTTLVSKLVGNGSKGLSIIDMVSPQTELSEISYVIQTLEM
jgi:hypothetical protein